MLAAAESKNVAVKIKTTARRESSAGREDVRVLDEVAVAAIDTPSCAADDAAPTAILERTILAVGNPLSLISGE